MKHLVLTGMALLGLVAAAQAQDSLARLAEEPVEEETAFPLYPATPELPRSLADSVDEVAPVSGFSLGPVGGFLRARHADNPTWFAGAQARLRLGYFAAEASIQFHYDRHAGGDVVVTQYPVQLTAFLYVIPEGPVRPYILGGVGWYYTNIDHRGGSSGIPDVTEQVFGEHLGGGLELFFGPRVSLDADVRYIFLNISTHAVINQDFNYWQVTFGLNFFF